jgi:hypothetical protein
LQCCASRAGGPAFVAGSGYNPGVEGQPLIWANGSVEYFTDQGPLSPIFTGLRPMRLVATAFSTWTGISGVALTASWGGHLAEDVNGSNIETNGFGVVTAPADITPSATGTPVGIVYDYDGTVTDACSARALEVWPIASPTPFTADLTTFRRAGTSCTRWW